MRQKTIIRGKTIKNIKIIEVKDHEIKRNQHIFHKEN